ncbi:uncharacterized protein LOC144663874 isoform X3 [Oculina patagonica]
MKKCLKVLSAAIIRFCIIYLQATAVESNNEDQQSEDTNQTTTPLTAAWVAMPPYTHIINNRNDSYKINGDHGVIHDALLRYIFVECGLYNTPPSTYKVENLEAESEFEMIELLRKNKADVAAPIFEKPDNRRHNEFPFFKLGDYPGTDFLTTEDETNPLRVVLDAIVEAWPLLAFLLISTAIAGIIMWALDTYWNSEEFPRPFIKGSLHGFWWSFISVTTVGYGDKVPKSIPGRIFSIIWILVGIINMTIFTANVTSALTALSLDLEPSSLVDLKVAVLGNGTEYQHALEEGAHPKVYDKIDDIIQAVKSKKVDGMFLDRYTASYYQSRGKLQSLITVKKLDFRRDIGVLFSKNHQGLASCLGLFRSNIWRLFQTLTATFKLTQQKPTKKVTLFVDSSTFVKYVVCTSLGVLLGMIIVGIVWDTFMRKKARVQEDVVLVSEAQNEGATARRQTIQNDVAEARKLLLQMQERFNKLEAKVREL